MDHHIGMPGIFYSLILWALSVTVLQAAAADMCIAENGDDALSRQSFGAWTLFRAKCSCLVSLPGSGESTFDMLVVKATPRQKAPLLSVMVSAAKEFAGDIDYFPVILNGKPIAAGAQPKAGVFLVELEGSIDWFNEVSKADTIRIGPYFYTSDQSKKAMSELLSCYASLKGK